MTSSCRWWRTGVICQIYPRSLKDTTGNGVVALSALSLRANEGLIVELADLGDM